VEPRAGGELDPRQVADAVEAQVLDPQGRPAN